MAHAGSIGERVWNMLSLRCEDRQMAWDSDDEHARDVVDFLGCVLLEKTCRVSSISFI